MQVHELFPYLCVSDAKRAIQFYSDVFGARETLRLTEPGGRIGHAQLDFNGTTVMLSDEFPEYGIQGPSGDGSTPVTLHLHVDDADAFIAKAISQGAKMEQEPQDHFYGERSGTIRDPFGHRWNIGHHIEEVSPEEMQQRYEAMFETSE